MDDFDTEAAMRAEYDSIRPALERGPRYASVRTVGELSRLLSALDPDTEVLFDQGEGAPWGNAKAGLVRRDGKTGPMALGITLDE